MKSVVTGEQTAVNFVEIDPIADAKSESETSSNDGSFSVAASKFDGQLIIPLPSGGALRLDWPLSFDYVADGSAHEPVDSEGTFTEVPVDSE